LLDNRISANHLQPAAITTKQPSLSTKEGSVGSPAKSVASKVTPQVRVPEERNPYKFIEKTLTEARVKLDKMKGTP
jgi:hypothetical protein